MSGGWYAQWGGVLQGTDALCEPKYIIRTIESEEKKIPSVARLKKFQVFLFTTIDLHLMKIYFFPDKNIFSPSKSMHCHWIFFETYWEFLHVALFIRFFFDFFSIFFSNFFNCFSIFFRFFNGFFLIFFGYFLCFS